MDTTYGKCTFPVEEAPLVVIPTYGEHENIVLLLPAIFALPTPFHVLVVDDASPDCTAQAVQSLQTTYPGRLHLISRPAKLGLGTAYVAGFRFALQGPYQYVLTMDADFSHAPADLLRLYCACQQGAYDVVIGSRYVSGADVVNWSLGRTLLSRGANACARCLTGLPIRDLTAGFHCYRRSVLEAIDLDAIRSGGYSFQIEMKLWAWKHGFVLQEVPIVFADRVRGASKLSGRVVLEAVRRLVSWSGAGWRSGPTQSPLQR